MATQRFLGAAWASVHGPADPRALWIWVLEQRFAGLGVGPGPRAVDWAKVAAVRGELSILMPRLNSTAETR